MSIQYKNIPWTSCGAVVARAFVRWIRFPSLSSVSVTLCWKFLHRSLAFVVLSSFVPIVHRCVLSPRRYPTISLFSWTFCKYSSLLRGKRVIDRLLRHVTSFLWITNNNLRFQLNCTRDSLAHLLKSNSTAASIAWPGFESYFCHCYSCSFWTVLLYSCLA